MVLSQLVDSSNKGTRTMGVDWGPCVGWLLLNKMLSWCRITNHYNIVANMKGAQKPRMENKGASGHLLDNDLACVSC
jgi:hypothetical protein